MRQTNKPLAAILPALLSCALAAFFCISAYGSGGCRDDRDWQEKMRAEKVAFLTSAMELTPAEAEKFWPLYHDMERDRKEAFGKVMKAYKALDEGVKAGRPEKEITALVNAYVQAMKDSKSTEAGYVTVFSKVIPMEKIARLFIGEEAFRRQQISRWHGDRKE